MAKRKPEPAWRRIERETIEILRSERIELYQQNGETSVILLNTKGEELAVSITDFAKLLAERLEPAT